MRAYGTDLYILWLEEAGLCKIGRSCNCERRLREIQSHMPWLRLELFAILPGSGWLETTLHNAFKLQKCGREWFWISPAEALKTCAEMLALPSSSPPILLPEGNWRVPGR